MTDMVALSPGEASMTVRVIRSDGRVEEVDGDEIHIDMLELVKEYNATVRRAKFLRAIIDQIERK